MKHIINTRRNGSQSSCAAEMLLGKLYFMTERLKDSQEILNACVDTSDFQSLEPDQKSTAYGLLAKIAWRNDNDLEKAQYLLHRAWQINNQDASVAFELGMALLYDSQHQDAREWFIVAETLNPSIDHKLLGKIYHFYELYDWAADSLQKVT